MGVGEVADAFVGEEDPVDVILGKFVSELVVFEADGFEEEREAWSVLVTSVVARGLGFVLDDRHALEALRIERPFEFGREGRFAIEESPLCIEKTKLRDELLPNFRSRPVGANEKGSDRLRAVTESHSDAGR